MTSIDAPAERWRSPYLRRMLDLQLGESVDLYPEEGDTLGALWARVRRQATRYTLTGRLFYHHKRADYIFVQRVEKGQRGKLAPYLRLAVGEKMLCTEPFETDRERKNLRRRLLYLLDELGHSVWLEQHPDGNLYYRCIGRLRTREPLWIEQPVDDGSDFKSAVVPVRSDASAGRVQADQGRDHGQPRRCRCRCRRCSARVRHAGKFR